MHTSRRLRPILVSGCLLAATVLSGCGGSSSPSAVSGPAPSVDAATIDPTPVTETASSTESSIAPESNSAPESSIAPEVSAAADPAASTAETSLDGTWAIADGSQAGFRVPEILNGQKTEAVGRTPAITGSMTVAGATVTATDFVFDLTQLKSDSDKRDAQVQTRIMDTAKFPTATFVLAEPIDFSKVPADQEQISLPAKGNLTVHGVTKPVTLDLKARRNGSNIEVLGSFTMTFADWSVPNPSFKPFVEVGESGLIEWLLVFAKK
jgi:polyisoprenoid-binding protein YceI